MSGCMRLVALLGGVAFAGIVPRAYAGTYTVLYSFSGEGDGATPYGGFTAVGSTLYGTTYNGGALNRGTVFAFNPTTRGKMILHSFGATNDGANPFSGALINSGGILYGVTPYGGSYAGYCKYIGCGTVFSVVPATHAEKVLYAFQDGADGELPFASLLYTGGTIYGSTSNGGTYGGGQIGGGTVFSLNPATGAEKVLYTFSGSSDGSSPYGGLISSAGLLYGTTLSGNTYGTDCDGEIDAGCGTVYSINPSTGAEKIVHSFKGSSSGDGSKPFGGLVAFGGLFYGTTLEGGAHATGALFSLNPATGAETVVHSFGGARDGSNPGGAIILVGHTLYGTTDQGGAQGAGTIFSFDLLQNVETVQYSLSANGRSLPPQPTGLVYVGGAFYGMTSAGGASNDGTIFRFTP
jgi:uncharacterized repeat protein (TIGR03803 family)